MILNYLLSISLLVMSVIKVTDLFHKANNDLNKTRQDFINLTKKHHKDGNVFITAALLTVMISALLYFYLSKFTLELKEANYRKESYLCFNSLNIETENYIYDMTKLNWLLRTSFIAMGTGVLTPKAKVAFEALKKARDARHLYYLKTLARNKQCPSININQISYLKNLPFKTQKIILLETNIDGTTILRSQKWDIIQYLPPSGIRLQKSFCLKSSWSAEGEFEPNLKVETEEIPMEGFSKLKCLSGFQSSA